MKRNIALALLAAITTGTATAQEKICNAAGATDDLPACISEVLRVRQYAITTQVVQVGTNGEWRDPTLIRIRGDRVEGDTVETATIEHQTLNAPNAPVATLTDSGKNISWRLNAEQLDTTLHALEVAKSRNGKMCAIIGYRQEETGNIRSYVQLLEKSAVPQFCPKASSAEQ